MFVPRPTSMSRNGTDRVAFAPTTSMHSAQNENVMHSSSSGKKTLKNSQQQQQRTPQSSSKHKSKIPQLSQQGPRRALGDISNKKKGLGEARGSSSSNVASKPGGGGAAASPAMKQQLWKSSTDAVTPRRLPLQQQQQRPVGSSNQKQQQSSSSSLVKPKGGGGGGLRVRSGSVNTTSSSNTSMIPRPMPSSALKPSKNRLLEFPVPQPPSSSLSILPKQTLIPSKEVTTITTTQTKSQIKSVVVEPVEDIERPAGRLWSEQQALMDADEDDSSFQAAYQDGMEEITTMWDDWRDVMVDQIQEKIRKEEAAEASADVAFDEKIFHQFKLVLDEDEKGLESLLDCVDDIDDATLCGPYGLGDDIDNWSDPASSVFGDDSIII